MSWALAKLLGLPIAATWLLSGCATGYLLDNNVQSFSSLAALPAQPAYRFERLPSQQAPAQAQLEAFADVALHKAGLLRDDANPIYSVQVSARLDRCCRPGPVRGMAGAGVALGDGWAPRWLRLARMGLGLGGSIGAWNHPGTTAKWR